MAVSLVKWPQGKPWMSRDKPAGGGSGETGEDPSYWAWVLCQVL